jgi:hypothetical protein
MQQFLVDAGIEASAILDDASALHATDAEAVLFLHGFVRQPDSDGYHIYDLGHPALHDDGKRALFASDGTITLVTFVSENDGFVQTIKLDANGAVIANTIEHIPAVLASKT